MADAKELGGASAHGAHDTSAPNGTNPATVPAEVPGAPHNKEAGHDASKPASSIAESESNIAVPVPGDAPVHDVAAVDDAPEARRSKTATALIMSSLCMAVFLAALDTTIITTALPTIAEHFKSTTGYTWIGSAYLLGSASTTPIWGKVSDIFGRKPILLIANIVFFVGSLLAAVSVNIAMLIAARALQGIGGGGLIVLVNICIGDLFSMRSRGAYYGMIGGVWALASAMGPLLGGAFTQKVSWRWCFYINLPLDGAAFFIILFQLNDLHTPRTPVVAGLKAIDWLGSTSVVGGTLMLLFGLEFGGITHPWGSATVICLLVFGIVTICLFLVNEYFIAPSPVIPLHIFKARSNIACLGVCFCHGFAFIGMSYYLPLFFQACLGATPILSGVYTLALALPLSFSSAFTGIYIRKTGKYLPPIYAGLFLMTLGFGLLIDLDPNSSWAKIILYQIVGATGVGPLFQAPLIALQSLINPQHIAAATATFQFTRNISTATSVVIGAVVFQNKMLKQQGDLVRILGPKLAARLGGFNAGANVGIVNALPEAQKVAVRAIFANALKDMWIMYTAFSAFGLLVSFLITRQTLGKEHKVTRTGLQSEAEKKQELKDIRSARRSRGSGVLSPTSPTSPTAAHGDLEKAVPGEEPRSPVSLILPEEEEERGVKREKV
ncbi:DNA repair protein RAD50 [Trichodelitschia bisporula]|uniref:Efflux pump dotC n=1 Tax=Trichodelitschia bisporula TaxID=703511 RepID=A0A6G1I6F3_9PEZI|nr:DNA repair protein RAD50 [Trichodelitschia bisporula]